MGIVEIGGLGGQGAEVETDGQFGHENSAFFLGRLNVQVCSGSLLQFHHEGTGAGAERRIHPAFNNVGGCLAEIDHGQRCLEVGFTQTGAFQNGRTHSVEQRVAGLAEKGDLALEIRPFFNALARHGDHAVQVAVARDNRTQEGLGTGFLLPDSEALQKFHGIRSGMHGKIYLPLFHAGQPAGRAADGLHDDALDGSMFFNGLAQGRYNHMHHITGGGHGDDQPPGPFDLVGGGRGRQGEGRANQQRGQDRQMTQFHVVTSRW